MGARIGEKAWRGTVRHGGARSGKAWQGPARYGLVGPGPVRQGEVRFLTFLTGETKMAKKEMTVKIEGLSALLMHAFPMVPVEAIEKKSKEEQSELSAYRVPGTKELYIPGIAIQRALVNGATYSKGKGRGSLQKVVAACVQVNPEYVGLGTDKYEIDSRPVVVPATKGRVMRHRPRLDKWAVTFKVEYDSDLLTAEQLRRVVDDTGSRVGLLDFRPERKGPFGRFMVTSWK